MQWRGLLKSHERNEQYWDCDVIHLNKIQQSNLQGWLTRKKCNLRWKIPVCFIVLQQLKYWDGWTYLCYKTKTRIATENWSMSSHTTLSNGDRWSQQRETIIKVSLDRIVLLACELFGEGFAKQSLLISTKTSKRAHAPVKLKGFRLQGHWMLTSEYQREMFEKKP